MKKIIDIYQDGILDGKIKEWDIDTYAALHSYSMKYDDIDFPTEIKHSYGIHNENIDVYKLIRKQEEKDFIKCFYKFSENIRRTSLHKKIQSIMSKHIDGE